MMLGARTAAWSGGKPTARDYVQDGLIAMWDGIENAGWGVHDASATVWKDLVGVRDLDLTTVGSFSEDALVCAGCSAHREEAFSPTNVELVWQGTNVESKDSIFFNFPNVIYAWYFGGYTPTGSGKHITSLDWGGRYSCNKDYVNATVRQFYSAGTATYSTRSRIALGNRDLNTTAASTNSFVGKIFSVRCYNRNLTAAEIAANYAVDKARFNLPDWT